VNHQDMNARNSFASPFPLVNASHKYMDAQSGTLKSHLLSRKETKIRKNTRLD